MECIKNISHLISLRQEYFEDLGMYFEFVVIGEPEDEFEYRFSQSRDASFLAQAETKKVSVFLTNTDTRIWNNLQNAGMQFIVSGDDGGAVATNFSFNRDQVLPGGTTRLTFDLRVGTIPRRYTLSIIPRLFGKNLFQQNVDMTFYVTSGEEENGSAVKADLIQPFEQQGIVVPQQRILVNFSFANTGNVAWKKGEVNIGKYFGREDGTNLADQSWAGVLRPATLQEELVRPGETGTFSFYIKPARTGVIGEYYKLGLQGVGWFDMDPVLIRLLVSESSETSAIQQETPKVIGDVGLSERYQKNIKIKLSFQPPNDTGVLSSSTAARVTNGENDMSLLNNQELTVFLQNGDVVARVGENLVYGDQISLIPENEGIVTIQNWERIPAWDTKRQYNDNQFRGRMHVVADGNDLVFINELPLEQYMHGIAEVPEANHQEKKKALAVLARTYALFYMGDIRKFPGKPYDGSDNPAEFQKYLGYSYELRSPQFSDAVEDTKGVVVTYNGELIKTPYFNQSDGWTKSAEEVWGWTHTPYLIAVEDPLCSEKVQKGHGVGLSGCGAEEAAKLGHDYETIIQYYYQGIEMEKIEG